MSTQMWKTTSILMLLACIGVLLLCPVFAHEVDSYEWDPIEPALLEQLAMDQQQQELALLQQQEFNEQAIENEEAQALMELGVDASTLSAIDAHLAASVDGDGLSADASLLERRGFAAALSQRIGQVQHQANRNGGFINQIVPSTFARQADARINQGINRVQSWLTGLGGAAPQPQRAPARPVAPAPHAHQHHQHRNHPHRHHHHPHRHHPHRHHPHQPPPPRHAFLRAHTGNGGNPGGRRHGWDPSKHPRGKDGRFINAHRPPVAPVKPAPPAAAKPGKPGFLARLKASASAMVKNVNSKTRQLAKKIVDKSKQMANKVVNKTKAAVKKAVKHVKQNVVDKAINKLKKKGKQLVADLKGKAKKIHNKSKDLLNKLKSNTKKGLNKLKKSLKSLRDKLFPGVKVLSAKQKLILARARAKAAKKLAKKAADAKKKAAKAARKEALRKKKAASKKKKLTRAQKVAARKKAQAARKAKLKARLTKFCNKLKGLFQKGAVKSVKALKGLFRNFRKLFADNRKHVLTGKKGNKQLRKVAEMFQAVLKPKTTYTREVKRMRVPDAARPGHFKTITVTVSRPNRPNKKTVYKQHLVPDPKNPSKKIVEYRPTTEPIKSLPAQSGPITIVDHTEQRAFKIPDAKSALGFRVMMFPVTSQIAVQSSTVNGKLTQFRVRPRPETGVTFMSVPTLQTVKVPTDTAPFFQNIQLPVIVKRAMRVTIAIKTIPDKLKPGKSTRIAVLKRVPIASNSPSISTATLKSGPFKLNGKIFQAVLMLLPVKSAKTGRTELRLRAVIVPFKTKLSVVRTPARRLPAGPKKNKWPVVYEGPNWMMNSQGERENAIKAVREDLYDAGSITQHHIDNGWKLLPQVDKVEYDWAEAEEKFMDRYLVNPKLRFDE